MPRRGRSGSMPDFKGKTPCEWVEGPRSLVHCWWPISASKTNFCHSKVPGNHKVPLRGTSTTRSGTKLRTSTRFLHGLSHWNRFYEPLTTSMFFTGQLKIFLPDTTLLSCRHERITPKWPFCFVSCWLLVVCVSINVYRMLFVFQHYVVTLQAREIPFYQLKNDGYETQ